MVPVRLGFVLLAWSLVWGQSPMLPASDQRSDVSPKQTITPSTVRPADEAAKPQTAFPYSASDSQR